MEDKDLLKNLNYINYSEEELSELERASLDSKNEYAEKVYKVKNEEIVRKIAFSELNKKAKRNLERDEVIKYKGIFLVSLLEKNIRSFQTIMPGFELPVYFGLFVTEKRIFIYKLTGRYKVIEYEEIQNIENLKYINDEREEIKTITLAFKDRMKIDLRGFNKENEELLLTIMNYLIEEKNIEVRHEKSERNMHYVTTSPNFSMGLRIPLYILGASISLLILVSIFYYLFIN